MDNKNAIELIAIAKGHFLESPETYRALQMGIDALQKEDAETSGSFMRLPIKPDGVFNGENVKMVGVASNGNYVIETWARNGLTGEFERYILSKEQAAGQNEMRVINGGL